MKWRGRRASTNVVANGKGPRVTKGGSRALADLKGTRAANETLTRQAAALSIRNRKLAAMAVEAAKKPKGKR